MTSSPPKKEFTLIEYYVPEDSDSIEIPNGFGIMKPLEKITITDIEENFPLEGHYHFRFKYKFNNQFVWMDISNKTCRLPTVDNHIIMKVTRKTWGEKIGISIWILI